MSYPYPQDRHRDRKEKGEQPYKDATETFAQNEAEIEREAGRPEQERANRSVSERERDAEERFEEIGSDVSGDREEGSR
ncbi:MAG TPA: hypothetical protein VD789_07025 [Thermomicrobiales bacterium]|nr:hypothetical protein [Thermomicrobiales bacterium]